MPKYQPNVLPARFSLNPDAFADVAVETLAFPFQHAVNQFRRDAEKVLNAGRTSGKLEYVTPDFRQLNNALLGYLPTLTHAFELYSSDDESGGQRRALAIGTSYTRLQAPTPAQFIPLLQAWAGEWVRRTEQINNGAFAVQIAGLGSKLLAEIGQVPAGWGWETKQVAPLLHDTGANEGMGFTAVPSILATLLHGRICTIVTPKGREIEVYWRKAQGAVGRDRTGLFVLSQPLHGSYLNEEGNEQEGYFAYRLDFRVETQAGRFHHYEDGAKLKPWVFVFLTCQRYGHEPLAEANHGRNLSCLVRLKAARIAGYPYDGTLVRLSAEKATSVDPPQYRWRHHLPEHLGNFRAAQLTSPEFIVSKPTQYANYANDPSWDQDEYLLVNATGYKYETDEGKVGDHAVLPGYSLRERAEVIEAVLDLLGGSLRPDTPFITDHAAPSHSKMPAAMRPHHFFRKGRKAASAAETGRRRVDEGIRRATGGRQLHLSLLWYEALTKDAAIHYIRETLFLNEHDPLPDWLTVTEKFIDGDCLEPLPKPVSGNKSAIDLAWDNRYARWHENVKNCTPPEGCPARLTLAEIGKIRQKGISPVQSIRGAVRAACSSAHVSSQLVQTATPRKNPKEGEGRYTDDTENRFRSAVQDLLLRQTGALMGEPAEIYMATGVPSKIASNLDVIAFCRRRCTAQFGRGDVQYVLAVRLRATGAVDVMLPHLNDWIPYVQAGHEIGRLFTRGRNVRFVGGKRPFGDIKLSGGDLAVFVHRVLTSIGSQPTLAMIEARGWRNAGGKETEGKVWPQLANPRMLAHHEHLDFSHVPEGKCYVRGDAEVEGLIGVVRLRDGDEAPHYVPNRDSWDADDEVRDLQYLSGFCDWAARPLLHYFSAGKSPITAKAQNNDSVAELFKVEVGDKQVWGMRGDPAALRIPYRHPPMIEMVPFFVHPDHADDDGLKALCRVPHYLRQSPSWALGNLDSSYPMHLGDTLIKDQLCIVGLDE